MSVTKEQIEWAINGKDYFEEDGDEKIEVMEAAYKEAIEALREASKMAEAIEKCTLEPDKVYIHAGRIKQAAKQAIDKYPG